MSPMLNRVDTLVTKETEKVGLPNVFFASVFTPKASSQEIQTLVVREKLEKNKAFPWSRSTKLEVI